MTDTYIQQTEFLRDVIIDTRHHIKNQIAEMLILLKNKPENTPLVEFYSEMYRRIVSPQVDEAHMLFIRHLIRLDSDFEPSVKNRQEDHELPNKPIFRLDS